MTNDPILEPSAPAQLRLWTAAALPLQADVAIRLRSLLEHIAILGLPGRPKAAQGDAAMASKLALHVMHDDDDKRRDLVMTALLLRADENSACRLILEHVRFHERQRRIVRAVEQALLSSRLSGRSA